MERQKSFIYKIDRLYGPENLKTKNASIDNVLANTQ